VIERLGNQRMQRPKRAQERGRAVRMTSRRQKSLDRLSVQSSVNPIQRGRKRLAPIEWVESATEPTTIDRIPQGAADGLIFKNRILRQVSEEEKQT
jgi:hypothetical protein